MSSEHPGETQLSWPGPADARRSGSTTADRVHAGFPRARCTAVYRRAMSDEPEPVQRIVELEIKLAYQDHVIRELDALVRSFGDRLDHAERELKTLKDTLVSPEVPPGPQHEPPPHY